MKIEHYLLDTYRYVRILNKPKMRDPSYLIEEVNGIAKTWAAWTEEGAIWMRIGNIMLKQDILIMLYHGTIIVEPEYKTIQQIYDYLDSLPKWTKTKYFIQMEGGSPALMYVESARKVPESIAAPIMATLKLGKFRERGTSEMITNR
jgi:hypothetical protein